MVRGIGVIAIAALFATTLGCTETSRGMRIGTTQLTSANQPVPPCRGDPPALPCHHADVGR